VACVSLYKRDFADMPAKAVQRKVRFNSAGTCLPSYSSAEIGLKVPVR
jgi:hypothetical protein